MLHNYYSDTSEIPGTLSAYGEEKDKPGIGTFHPPEEDAASIKSDVMNEENQNSEPLSPPNEEPESLHPPDTYDRLPKPPNGQSEVQPFNGYSEADTYDRLRQPVSGYTKLILNQSSDSPDIYDKLVPQKVRCIFYSWHYVIYEHTCTYLYKKYVRCIVLYTYL